MSNGQFNRLRNLGQLFCDRALAEPTGANHLKIEIQNFGIGSGASSFFASMDFLKELSRQALISGFEEVSDGFALRGAELTVAKGIYARGANDGSSVVVTFPLDVAEEIDSKVSFDFNPNPYN